MDLFNLAPERKLYEILKHSSLEEREILCKNNKFKAMCKLIDFDTNTKLTGPLQGQGRATFKVILESFPDFSSGLQFIESIHPGFVYTPEFEAYVKDFLEIKHMKTHDGKRYTSFILGDLEYRIFKDEFGENTIKEEWYKNSLLHRENDLPSQIEYEDSQVTEEYWYLNGKRYRKDGPAVIWYYGNKQVLYECWYLNDKRHREDYPAEIGYYKDGQVLHEYWYLNGKRHRKDGPAEIWYYDNGQVNVESWYMNDKLHRKDGPAHIEYFEDGQVKHEDWYLNGKRFKNLF